MRIVQISTEFAPLAKAGGMGEVVVGLARELSLLGHKVDVIIPKYDFIDLKKLSQLKLEIADFKCVEKGQLYANAIWSALCEGCQLHLLEARHPAGYFYRGKIYGCDDDTQRFLYFCKAALEYLKLKGEEIDILHLHDWHSAACAILARDLFQLKIRSILLTLHNVEYQGKCATWDLDAIGLPGVKYLTENKLKDDDPANPKTLNLLKGGLVYADGINTVSKSYAKEILTPQMGFHLDKTLRKLKHKLTGILNGIDLQLWDPTQDPHLPVHFPPSFSIEEAYATKEKIRAHLGKTLGIDLAKRPWVGAITRLAFQKGPEFLEAAIERSAYWGVTFLLLGSAPNPKIQARFDALKKKYQGKPQIFLHFEYDEALAHQIYGALDFILIPSHFEPCGLTQLIGMHYGVVPIARATGGLKDTIFDCEDPSIPTPVRNGFLFSEPTFDAMDQTIQRALKVFREDKPRFQNLILAGLKTDYSWEKPTQEYLKLYNSLL